MWYKVSYVGESPSDFEGESLKEFKINIKTQTLSEINLILKMRETNDPFKSN